MTPRQYATSLTLLCAVGCGAAEPERTYISFDDNDGAFISGGASPAPQAGSQGGCIGSRCGTGEGEGFKSSADATPAAPSHSAVSPPPSSQAARNGGVIAEWRELMGYSADGSTGGGRGIGGGFDVELEKASRLIPESKQYPLLDRSIRAFMEKTLISVEIPSKDLQAKALNEFGAQINTFLSSRVTDALRIAYLPPPLSDEVINHVRTAYNKIFWNLRHQNPADDVKLANWYAARAFEGMEQKRLPLYETYASNVENLIAKFAREFELEQARPEIHAGAEAPKDMSQVIENVLKKNPRAGVIEPISPETAASRSVKRRMGLTVPYLREDNPFYSANDGLAKPRWESQPGKFRASLEQLHERLANASPANIQGVTARELGLRAVKNADHAFATGRHKDASALKEIAVAMSDIALGFIPFVGLGRDLYEVTTGLHLLTGRSLSDSERFISALGVLTIGGFGVVKAGLELVKDEARLGRAGQVLIKALDGVVVRSAEDVSHELRKSGYLKDTYKPGTRVYEFTSPAPIEDIFVRVYTEGKTSPSGRWLMEKSSISGLSAEQIAKKFSLENIPTHVIDAKIPLGLRMRKGVPARIMLGSGETAFPKQYEIVDIEKLSSQWFANPRHLN